MTKTLETMKAALESGTLTLAPLHKAVTEVAGRLGGMEAVRADVAKLSEMEKMLPAELAAVSARVQAAEGRLKEEAAQVPVHSHTRSTFATETSDRGALLHSVA